MGGQRIQPSVATLPNMSGSEIGKLETEIGWVAVWLRNHEDVLGPNILVNANDKKMSK